MSAAFERRLAALTGLALAAAVALWWLGSTRLALDRGSDASRAAAQALHALWLVRGLVLAIWMVRLGALRGWPASAAAALVLIAPSWPLVVLAWSASAVPLLQVLGAELALLAAGAALPLAGLGLRRVLRRPELADVVAVGVGAALAAALWAASGGR